MAKNTRRIGYAVVGLGHIAQAAVLPAFANAKNARLVALVSSDDEKLRELGDRYGVEHLHRYDEYDECLAHPEVDAVYIALPNHMHCEYTVQAARAGVHVLCEKPMALSAGECQQMIRACDDADVRLMIAYRLHFERANLSAIELAKSGTLGDLRLFSSEFSFQVKPGNIRVRRETGGGVVWDIGIYCINAARYIFRAEPEEVFAFGTPGHDDRFAEVFESVNAVMRFPDGRLGQFVCSFGASAVATYRVVGTLGDLRLDHAYEYVGSREHVLTVNDKTTRRKFRPLDQFGPELVYFSACVLEGREPEPSGWEGLADVQVVQAIHESLELCQPVRVQAIERRERPEPSQEIELRPVTEPPLVHVDAPHQ